jgi:hypothetical protein
VNLANMLRRAARAAMLDKRVYEEVEHDESLNKEALAVVALAALATGVGAALERYQADGAFGQGTLIRLLYAMGASLLLYFIWSGVTYYVGTGFFGGRATPGQLRRTLGYASAPQALGFFRFLAGPTYFWVPFAIGLLWSIATGFVAIRQALDVSNGKTLGVVLIGGGIAIMVITFVFGFLGFLIFPIAMRGMGS